MRRSLRFAFLALAAGIACRPPEQRSAPRRVAIEPDVVNFSRHGDQLVLAGRVFEGGLLQADSAAFQWKTLDTAVATVGADGTVTATGDGVTRVWGVSGPDSAFAVIVVERPPVPIVVAVTPPRIRLTALSARSAIAASTTDPAAVDSIPVCRSERPNVVAVESLTVIARGNGTSRIICAIAGVEGTAEVTVIQRISQVRVVSSRDFTLRVGRDSLVLSLARVDSLRQPVAGGAPRFRSLDTSVVRVDSLRGTAIAVARGSARVVGSIERFQDTATIRVVDVAPPPAVNQLALRRAGGAAGGSARRPTSRATSRAVPARAAGQGFQVGARDIEARDSVFQTGGLTSTSFARWAPAGSALLAERRLDLGLSSTVRTLRLTGVLFGVEAEYAPRRWLHFGLSGFTGRLSAPPDSAAASEIGVVTELATEAGVNVLPGFWLQVGAARRSIRIESPEALEITTMMRLVGEARVPLGKGALQGTVRAGIMPLMSVSAATNRPKPEGIGLLGGAGLSFHKGALSAGLHYGIDRFRFPVTATGRRQEQFSTLKFRLGLELGR